MKDWKTCSHTAKVRVDGIAADRCTSCGMYFDVPAASPQAQARHDQLRRMADEAWERGNKTLSTQLHEEATRAKLGGRA